MKIESGRKLATQRRVRYSQIKTGNIALVPATELASMAKWRKRAQDLGAGEMLLVLPRNNPRLQAAGRRIKVTLTRQGKHVTVTTVH
jgi:hypothetical protein